MQIIQYVYWDKPGEKEKMKKLLETCESEIQLRMEIAKAFNISSIEAGVVFNKFKTKFYQKIKK